MKHWLISILIAANQLGNALTGGDPQMSISARSGFAREHGSRIGKIMCKLEDIPDIHHPNPKYPDHADHCIIAIIDYRNRKHNVK